MQHTKIIIRGRHKTCSNCNEPMTGMAYGFMTECYWGGMSYDDYSFPLPLKCPDCGKYDWKHDHNLRYKVFYCKNENCKQQDCEYVIDTINKKDYSRIPFWECGLEGYAWANAYEFVFGVREKIELMRLGRKMKMKEIEKKLKQVKKKFKEYKKHDSLYARKDVEAKRR